MNENTIEWKTVNRKLKIERIKRKIKKAVKSFVDWVKRTVNAAVKWFSENKEFALVTLPILAGLATKGYKLAMAHREDVIRTRRFYDPRKGRYSTARRDLSTSELREIDERYAAGESYRSILDDMGGAEMIEIIKSVFNCTKKVVEFLDTHKVEIAKGVLSLMTITFADGKINVSIDGSPKGPELKNTYTDITPTTATAAIDAFAATANEASWDSDKLGCAYKIVKVIKNTPNVSDSTKQHAIKALGAIKNSMTWSSDKQRCDDYIMAIINL